MSCESHVALKTKKRERERNEILFNSKTISTVVIKMIHGNRYVPAMNCKWTPRRDFIRFPDIYSYK